MSVRSASEAQASARNAARSARDALTNSEREKKSLLIAARLAKYLPYRKAKRIGIYFSIRGEVNMTPIIEMSQSLGKELFAPVINTAAWREPGMLFHAFEPGVTKLQNNRFNIPEPVHRPGTCIRGTDLDLVFVPVVAFNRHCDRIGMGGGYYDRAFAGGGVTPVRLVGVAFDCQGADFGAQAHDVPMDAVVTESVTLVR